MVSKSTDLRATVAKLYGFKRISDLIEFVEKYFPPDDKVKSKQFKKMNMQQFHDFMKTVVTIPDANFKAYLVGNSAINSNGDTEIQISEARMK